MLTWSISYRSTFDPSYADSQRDDIIRNGFDAATQGNGTLDSQWPVCMACAMLSRSLVRTATAVPSACTDCFNKYCWNGTLDATDKGPYLPNFKIGNGTTAAKSLATTSITRNGWSLILTLGVAAVLFL